MTPEVQRIKKTAAVHSAKSNQLDGVPQNRWLVQVITDNYDIEMGFQNNKLVSHSLATVLRKNREYLSQMLTPRLKKQEMTASLTKPEDLNIIHYFGPKTLPYFAFRKFLSTILLSICSKLVVEEPE